MHGERLHQLGRLLSAGLAAASIAAAACHRRAEPHPTPDPRITLASVAPPAAAPLAAQPAAPGEPSPREALGRAIFFDDRLSYPAGTSCASCHDPARAYSGNHGSKMGVALGSREGHFARRNTPSVLYMRLVPAFHFALEDDDDLAPSPFGGLGWGGRADSVAEFVRLPLLDADEMNNGGESDVAAKLRSAPYADAFAREFPGAFEAPSRAVAALGQAVEAFLVSDAMSPFTSKYDDYLRHTAALSPPEMRGMKLFEAPEKGACNACHLLEKSSNRPSRSPFTNFGYDAVAVPRNRAIPANRDPAQVDLGLCERKDTRTPSSDAQWCGAFRTPSLRNVAVRERFMHNGRFTSLRDVVAFYATRSTDPSRWYPHGEKFDDVPARYRGNVNVASLPYNRREGAQPALDDGEIDAIVLFLQTLTDAAYR